MYIRNADMEWIAFTFDIEHGGYGSTWEVEWNHLNQVATRWEANPNQLVVDLPLCENMEKDGYARRLQAPPASYQE